MLLNLGDEERLPRAATAAQFERLDGSFLPPSHPATQRVAGILWKLVNRLDPTLVVGTNPTDENLSTHPLLAEGATWSLHVYDSPRGERVGGARRPHLREHRPDPRVREGRRTTGVRVGARDGTQDRARTSRSTRRSRC